MLYCCRIWKYFRWQRYFQYRNSSEHSFFIKHRDKWYMNW